MLAAPFVAALLVALVFALPTREGAGARRAVLPHVVGTPVATAASTLRARGFAVRTLTAAHASAAAGTVAAMRPRGTSAVRGTTVSIVPSSGPRPIAIPSLSGFTKEAAVAASEQLGLLVQPTTAFGSAASGIAVATTPPAGTAVVPGSSVTLTISAGPAVAPAEPAPSPSPSRGGGQGSDNQGGGGGD